MSIEYLAGFFDGEGCITLAKNGGLTVSVVNTNYPILCMYQDRFGGSLSERKQMVNKEQFQWRAYGLEAELFLEDINDYLIDKQDQARTALKYLIERDVVIPLRKAQRGAFANPDRVALITKYRNILTEQKLGKHIDQ